MASILLLFLAASCCACLCLADGDTSLEFETRALEFPHKSQEEKDLVSLNSFMFVKLFRLCVWQCVSLVDSSPSLYLFSSYIYRSLSFLFFSCRVD